MKKKTQKEKGYEIALYFDWFGLINLVSFLSVGVFATVVLVLLLKEGFITPEATLPVLAFLWGVILSR